MMIHYICGFCSMDEISITVREREPGEEILHYMEDAITRALAEDHQLRSPWCTTKEFKQVKIPLPHGSDGVGFPASH